MPIRRGGYPENRNISLMKTIKSVLILLCLATLASAQTVLPETPKAPDASAQLAESQERVSYLTKLCNGIEQQRNAASGRAENAALQLSIANEMIADYKQKLS